MPTPSAMPLLQNLRIGDEHVVADELHAVAERARQRLPAVPVAFGDAVLDRDDRILADPVGVHLDHLVGAARRLARLLEDVPAVVPQLARGDVEREEHVLPGRVARLADRLEHQVERLAVRSQVRRESAFVADAGRMAGLLQDRAERVKDLGAGAQRLGEASAGRAA